MNLVTSKNLNDESRIGSVSFYKITIYKTRTRAEQKFEVEFHGNDQKANHVHLQSKNTEVEKNRKFGLV